MVKRALKPWQEYLIIYMLLLMAGNPTIMLYRSLVFTTYKVVFLAGIVLLFLIYKNSRLKVKTEKLKICLFFYGMVVLSVILNRDKGGVTTLFSYFVFIMLGLLISEIIRPERFGIVYMNVMLLISGMSLCLFATQICFPNELYRFLWTDHYVNEAITYRSNIFYNVLASPLASSEGYIWMVERNSGLFWEPGVFAAFLLSAIVCLIEYKDMVHKYQMKLLIFLIALVSTVSSMGIITLGLIVLWYTIKNVKIFGRYIVLGAIVLLTAGRSLLNGFLTHTQHNMQGSMLVSRTGLSELTLDNIKMSLLWGQGFNGTLSYNGYINLFFMFGLLFFLVWLVCFFRGCCKVAGIVLFFSIMMGLTSEPIAFTAIFWVYVFFGTETAGKMKPASLKEL